MKKLLTAVLIIALLFSPSCVAKSQPDSPLTQSQEARMQLDLDIFIDCITMESVRPVVNDCNVETEDAVKYAYLTCVPEGMTLADTLKELGAPQSEVNKVFTFLFNETADALDTLRKEKNCVPKKEITL